jgi:hypothetical protein
MDTSPAVYESATNSNQSDNSDFAPDEETWYSDPCGVGSCFSSEKAILNLGTLFPLRNFVLRNLDDRPSVVKNSPSESGAGSDAPDILPVTPRITADGFRPGGNQLRGGSQKLLDVGVRWDSESRLAFKYEKHSNEWKPLGGITKEQYARRAEALLRTNPGEKSVLGFTNRNGFRFRYNSRTNEFATMKPDGTIETMFRPRNGSDYYAEQLKQYSQSLFR